MNDLQFKSSLELVDLLKLLLFYVKYHNFPSVYHIVGSFLKVQFLQIPWVGDLNHFVGTLMPIMHYTIKHISRV